MARFNEILVGRYNRALQKLLSMKGGPPSAQLSTEIQPVLELERVPRELRFLFGHGIFAISVTVAASAANFSSVRLRNPGNSGVIAIIERIRAAAGAVPTTVSVVQNSTGSWVAGPAANQLDARMRVNSSTSLVETQQGAFAGGGTLVQDLQAGSAVSRELLFPDLEVILVQGNNLAVTSSVVNQAITVDFWWRERPLEEGELA